MDFNSSLAVSRDLRRKLSIRAVQIQRSFENAQAQQCAIWESLLEIRVQLDRLQRELCKTERLQFPAPEGGAAEDVQPPADQSG